MTGLTWTTACPDWERRIVARESLVAFPPLFPDEADEALEQMRALRIVDAPHSPTIGEASLPWVFDLPRALFGAYDCESGRRLITEYFLCVSKKNWKSGLAASIMLTALLRNWRETGEFAILAPTIEIAGNSFVPARAMIRADEQLSDLLHVQDHTRTITHRNTHATLKVVAADSETVGGKKSIGVLIDEAWLFGKRANAEKMLLEATGGQASRPEGFTIWLTTQSDEPPAGVFDQKLKYARGVRDGRIHDPSFLPLIYEYPQAMLEERAYLKPENFYVTNPNLGVSVDEQFLQRKLSMAQESGEESLQAVLAKHFNVEIGLALRSNNWPGAEFWERCGDTSLTLGALLERSEVVVIGIDGGGLDDLLGLCVMGRETGTGKWLTWNHAWVHPIAMERRKSEASKYQDFAKDGDLTIVKVGGEDIKGVGDVVEQCEASGLLDRIGVDRAGIDDIVDEIESRKIENDRIVGVAQGWRMNGAVKTTERRVSDGMVVHSGSRLMAWCVGSARVEQKGNAVLVTKQASGTGKIDPVMATFNAAALMAMNPAPRKKKYQVMVFGGR